jgi:hypothetical protein
VGFGQTPAELGPETRSDGSGSNGFCVKVAVLIETSSAALTFKVVIKTSRFNKHGPFSNGRLLKYGFCLKVTVLMETFSDALKVTVRIEKPSVAGHLSVPPKAFD